MAPAVLAAAVMSDANAVFVADNRVVVHACRSVCGELDGVEVLAFKSFPVACFHAHGLFGVQIGQLWSSLGRVRHGEGRHRANGEECCASAAYGALCHGSPSLVVGCRIGVFAYACRPAWQKPIFARHLRKKICG